MPVIYFNGTTVETLTGRNGLKKTNDGMEVVPPVMMSFVPGPNDVSDEDWDKLQKESERCRDMLDGGELRLARVSLENGGTTILKTVKDTDISKLSTPSAMELVRGVVDVDQLNQFLVQEKKKKGGGRKPLLKVLEAQIKDVTEPADKKETELIGKKKAS